MIQDLLFSSQVQVALAAVSAGTSTQTGTTIDTQGYDGVLIIGLIGTVTSTGVPALIAKSGNASNMSDEAAMTGGTATGDDTMSGKALVVNVHRPLKRYVRGVITRTTANVVINGMVYILYRGRKRPETKDSTVFAQANISGV